MLGLLILFGAIHIFIHDKESRIRFLKAWALVFTPMMILSIIMLTPYLTSGNVTYINNLDNVVWTVLGISAFFTTVYYVFSETK